MKSQILHKIINSNKYLFLDFNFNGVNIGKYFYDLKELKTL